MNNRSFIVIGGGIIGMAMGWQLSRRGHKVTVIEKNLVGGSATWAAAGMLAPYAEVSFEEEALLELGQASLQLYPKFLSELAEDAENVPEIFSSGSLIAGMDRDDTERIRRLFAFKEKLDFEAEMITGTRAREIEPLLSPRAISAMWLPQDKHIDNRALVLALKEAFLKHGGTLLENTEVTSIEFGDQEHTIQTSGEALSATDIVSAAGAWSNSLPGLDEELRIPVRPVKGQIITLKMTDEVQLKHMIRTPRVYLCPKEDGTLRIGATSEEKGFDITPTAGGMKDLLENAWEALPSIYDLPVTEFFGSLRPASPDHYPMIGKTNQSGFYYAAGFYRHGILLAPITAYHLSDIILNDEISELIRPFEPMRFADLAGS